MLLHLLHSLILPSDPGRSATMGVPDVVPVNLQIVFVLGGPGAGKGTQCTRLAQDYSLQHLSLGDVLRKERDTPGSEYGELIARNMEQGRIGPMEVTVSLLRKAILASTVQTDSRLFLIDGRLDHDTFILGLVNWQFLRPN